MGERSLRRVLVQRPRVLRDVGALSRALLELGELRGQVRWRAEHDGEFGEGVGGAVHPGKMSW